MLPSSRMGVADPGLLRRAAAFSVEGDSLTLFKVFAGIERLVLWRQVREDRLRGRRADGRVADALDGHHLACPAGAPGRCWSVLREWASRRDCPWPKIQCLWISYSY